jgi:plastocyanin
MPRTTSARLLLCAAALALVATACSSGDDADTASPGSPAPTAPAPAEVEPTSPDPATPDPATPAPEETADGTGEAASVTIEGFEYEVPESVEAGSQVSVVNDDREAHTFTLAGSDVQVVVQGGATETFTAPDAGSYTVTCDFHGGMTAELVVT